MVSGGGGHTSRPHLTGDVVFALGQVITQVPAVLGRRLDPRSGVNLTWGAVQAGTAPERDPVHRRRARAPCAASTCARGSGRRRCSTTPSSRSSRPTGSSVEVRHARGVPPVENDDRGDRASSSTPPATSLGDGSVHAHRAVAGRRGLRLVPHQGPRRDGAARRRAPPAGAPTTSTRATSGSTSARSPSARGCSPAPRSSAGASGPPDAPPDGGGVLRSGGQRSESKRKGRDAAGNRTVIGAVGRVPASRRAATADGTRRGVTRVGHNPGTTHRQDPQEYDVNRVTRLAGLAAATALALAACGAAPRRPRRDRPAERRPRRPPTSPPASSRTPVASTTRSFNQLELRGHHSVRPRSSAPSSTRSSRTPRRTTRATSSRSSPRAATRSSRSGFALSATTVESAMANPDIDYILVDDAADNDFDGTKDAENVKPLLYDTAQAAFLAGLPRRGLLGGRQGRHLRRPAVPDRDDLHGRLQAGRRLLQRDKDADGRGRRLQGGDQGSFTGRLRGQRHRQGRRGRTSSTRAST